MASSSREKTCSSVWRECKFLASAAPRCLNGLLINDCRLIVVSIFCLCLGHPGYAFNDKTIRYSQVTRGEVTGQLLPHGIEMAPKPAVDRYYSYESGGH